MRDTFLSSILAASIFSTCVSAALDPIVIKGSKFFFKSNGTQFFIKGVAYQAGVSGPGIVTTTQTYNDPLGDPTTCKRDIPYLQQLGANTIRTYALDPTINHDDCMQMLDDAGIYLISDLGEPTNSINRESPAWDLNLYQRYTDVVDAMQKYDNVIGFFAGNEVTNNASYTPASAFVKAAVRDTKAYIASKGYRTMGVGYAADDDASVRRNVANYLNCGNSSDSIDFWGYNIYEWCGDSNYVTSGYINRTAEFKDYNVPVFFAEYGCNANPGGAAGRKFTEVAALYGDQMDVVFSGGIVYEYFQEENDYGLVSVIDDDTVSTLADFAPFSSQIHAVNPTSATADSYNPTNTAAQACPTIDESWQVAASGLPPTPNDIVCNCMVATLSCVAKSDLEDTEIGELFGLVCGYNDGKPCEEIAKNTTTGVFGAYSMCNAIQQLSYAFDTYYQEEGNSGACDFDGKAQIVKPAGTQSCSIISRTTISATREPTKSSSGSKSLSTSASGSVTGSSSGSESAAAATSTSKKNDGNSMAFSASLGLGTFCFVAYAAAAVLSGVGMVWL